MKKIKAIQFVGLLLLFSCSGENEIELKKIDFQDVNFIKSIDQFNSTPKGSMILWEYSRPISENKDKEGIVAICLTDSPNVEYYIESDYLRNINYSDNYVSFQSVSPIIYDDKGNVQLQDTISENTPPIIFNYIYDIKKNKFALKNSSITKYICGTLCLYSNHNFDNNSEDYILIDLVSRKQIYRFNDKIITVLGIKPETNEIIYYTNSIKSSKLIVRNYNTSEITVSKEIKLRNEEFVFSSFMSDSIVILETTDKQLLAFNLNGNQLWDRKIEQHFSSVLEECSFYNNKIFFFKDENSIVSIDINSGDAEKVNIDELDGLIFGKIFILKFKGYFLINLNKQKYCRLDLNTGNYDLFNFKNDFLVKDFVYSSSFVVFMGDNDRGYGKNNILKWIDLNVL